jgi:hypothetical protein
MLGSRAQDVASGRGRGGYDTLVSSLRKAHARGGMACITGVNKQ